jgi:predicted Zn-ribbon and HTH transcriptional regulator
VISETVYIAYTGNTAKICVCGAKTAFVSFTTGYRTFCGASCMSSSSLVKIKRVQSIKNTCLEKYGVSNVLKVPAIKKKAQDTLYARYGVTNFAQHSLHAEMVKETCLKKYGVSHPLSHVPVREKIKSTLEEKYGGFGTASPVLRTKIKDTMQDRYGVISSALSTVILSRIKDTKKVSFIDRLRENDFEIIQQDPLIVKHECGEVFNADYFTRTRCPNCKHTSIPEAELYRFLKTLGIKIIRNDRLILDGRELDIVLPDYKIAIEMNGAFWHHSTVDKLTLLEKTKLAKLAGYELIHIWDFEWYTEQEIIMSKLRSALDLNIKVPAEKCTVKSIDKSAADEFLMECDLNGPCKSSMRLGLFYDEILVGVAVLGKSRFEAGKYEVFRVAFKSGIQIAGGIDKLLSAVPGELIVHVDARFMNARSYIANGFKLAGLSKPKYSWYKNGKIIESALYKRSELPKLLVNYDPAKTTEQNMIGAGYLKLIDCGRYKLVRAALS